MLKGAGLGDYNIEIRHCSSKRWRRLRPVTEEDNGEDVSYTIQLIVLDYTIIPFVEIENV
jgi:hypothetical protein